MMTRREPKIPENYHRVLKVLAQHIEETADEIIVLMKRDGREAITSKVRASYSREERVRALQAAEKLKAKLSQFVDAFHLEKQTFTEDQIMHAKLTHLWTLLEDTRSKNLVGYGRIPLTLQKEIDSWIEDFLRVLNEFGT